MPKKIKKEEFTYEAPQPVKAKKGVLGTLVGPCADIINPTRNGRKYDEGVWEKAFNNEIVKEYFEAGGIFGELGHPADRSETDPEKIAICMPEPPVKNDKGLLVGRWDILDTPNGRILKTLVDYGYKIGISSRGNGEVYEDLDGQEHVDEDTYDFQAFDAVLLPAVKAARLDLVKESLDTKKTLKQALTESYNKASADEKKVMLETLDTLNLKLNEEKESEDDEQVYEVWGVVFGNDRNNFGDEEEWFNTKEEALARVKKGANAKYALVSKYETMSPDEVPEGEPLETKVYTATFAVEDEKPVVNEAAEEDEIDDIDLSVVFDEPIEGEEQPAEESEEEVAVEEEPAEEEQEEEMSYEDRVHEFIEKLPEILEIKELSEEQNDELFNLFIGCFPEEEMGGNIEEPSEEEVPAEEEIVEPEEEKEVEEEEESEEAKDLGSDVVLENLQQALKTNASLNAKILDIQNKLAVSDTKVEALNEELTRYKLISDRFSSLLKEKKELVKQNQQLQEQLSSNAKKVKLAEDKAKAENKKSLEESIKNNETIYKNKIETLNESINNLKKDSEIKEQKLTTQLEKSNKLVEQYKKLALNTVQRYIDSKALMLGVSSNEIKNRLSESYTIDDIDQICEDLQEYNLNMSRLPFQIDKNSKIKFVESKNDNLRVKSRQDDDIDKSLLRLAGLDK